MNIKVVGMGEEELKKDLLNRIANLYILRKERLYYVANPRVSSQMWAVLSIAAAIAISTTFLFPFSILKTKAILTVSYSSMLGLILFLIVCLNYPYKGAIRVTPEAFLETQKMLRDNK